MVVVPMRTNRDIYRVCDVGTALSDSFVETVFLRAITLRLTAIDQNDTAFAIVVCFEDEALASGKWKRCESRCHAAYLLAISSCCLA